ncbi:fatty acid desaturase family protein [Zhouia sp. PK063]|uniref:fatty acid desaturase family protein n=1 Tax=Zhouia sp. PK063 TaxID=3373602 RepID=UPI003788CCF4
MENTTTQQKSFKKPTYPRSGENVNYQELRKEVNTIVKDLAPQRSWLIKFKAFVFPLLYFSAYALILSSGNSHGLFFTGYFLLGFLLVLNFLNLIHEAVHGVIFKSFKWMNNIYVSFFDIMGANSYIWKVRHIRFHHAYPNIMDWDTDFEQSPMARVFPEGPILNMHKYQHIYLPFIYPLYLFNWLLVRDFKDFYKKDSMVRRHIEIPKKEYVKLFIFKAIFIFYIFFLPKLMLDITWGQELLGFILMMFTASLTSLIVLLSPHASIHSEFPRPDENGNMPYTWFTHQLRCTNDVKSNDGFFVRFFMGNFNYHIAHHLFPHIHHIYYPEVTKAIENFAIKNNLPYRKYSLSESLKGHYKLLKTNAFHENIFEETM